jgi:hypothetical protein
MIMSRRIRWEWYVARMGEKGNACRFMVEKLAEKSQTRKT